MVTMRLNHMFFLTFLLMFSVTNAISKEEIDKICGRARSPNCYEILGGDSRVKAAPNLSDTLIVVISMLKTAASEGTTQINAIGPQIKGQNEKKQVDHCVKNYGIATTKFASATHLALKKAFREVENVVRAGSKAVTECFGQLRAAPAQPTIKLKINMQTVQALSNIAYTIVAMLNGR